MVVTMSAPVHHFAGTSNGRVDGDIVVDLMLQAGIDVLPRRRGADGQYPPPAGGDGLRAELSTSPAHGGAQ